MRATVPSRCGVFHGGGIVAGADGAHARPCIPGLWHVGGARDPADRLEQALTRIAFAIECREEGTWPPAGSVPSPTTQPTDPGIDLQALAANIDALIARVRDALSDGGAATVIADIKGK